MSNDLVPHLPRVPMGAGTQMLQKVGVLGAKAALSAIPWAALVFDLGQAAVDYGNARLMDRLLNELGDRVDRMEAGSRERLQADEIYQMSAQAAIRRMLSETNPNMADALARAVSALGLSDLPAAERMEIARSLDVLNEPILHLLQTMYRVQHGMLTPKELQLTSDASTHEGFTEVLTQSMPLLSWIQPVNELQRSGMVEEITSDGYFRGSQAFAEPGEVRVVPLSPVFPLGEQVVQMCFDDLTRPAFGLFAGN